MSLFFFSKDAHFFQLIHFVSLEIRSTNATWNGIFALELFQSSFSKSQKKNRNFFFPQLITEYDNFKNLNRFNQMALKKIFKRF